MDDKLKADINYLKVKPLKRRSYRWMNNRGNFYGCWYLFYRNRMDSGPMLNNRSTILRLEMNPCLLPNTW